MKKTYRISCGSTSWEGRICWQWKYGRHCVIDILLVFSIPSRLLFSLCSPLAPFSAHLNTWNRPVWSSTYHENTPLSNSPYAWLRQTSKFHQQASFVNKIFCICTFCAWVFFSTLLPWEFISVKLRLFLISKRGLVVKFACVTQTCIRAIEGD